MRYVYQLAAAVVALSSLFSTEAYGQGVQGLSITNYQFVSEQRFSQTQSYITYRADLRNTGSARDAVTATVSSPAPSVQTVPGQTNLHFSPVPANSQVTSSNTFTILVDRSVPFDVTTLQWSFLAPFANAGPNQTVSVGATVTVNGSASTNPSGAGNLSYKWTFVSRPPGTATKLLGSDSVIAQFTADVSGNYVLSLTVSNGVGSDTAFVTVSTNNSPPVANAGPNQTVGLGSTVTLNGGGSSDVDGDPLTYSWVLISRPAGSTAALTGANTISPSFVVDKAGTYVAQLIVNDGKVDSAPSTVQITTVNTPPVANAGSNQIVNVSSVVQLNGSGSTDVDGDSLTYHWTFNSRPAGSTAALNNATAVNPTFTADVPGTYVIQLIVNDGKADSNPATVTITTNALQPPTANAGSDQTVQHGATVSLNGSATDPQGLPLTFHWSLTTKPAGSTAVLSSTTIARPTFVADVPGTYIAQLIANNGFLNSAPSMVTIATTNVAPVANAGPDQTAPVGATVALDGSGSSDADHDPLTFAWSLLTRPNGSAAALSAATSASPTFVADVAGTYVAQLIVNDGFANSDPKTVTITAGLKSITLTPNPLNLATNSSGTLTVTLGSPAGSGGLTVKLVSSDTTIVSVPSSITIPENSTSATVSVTSTANAGSAFVLATATGFSNGSATINTSPSGITVKLDSNTVGITTTTNGTITLSSPAPAGGVIVNLTATPSGIVNVPATVTIASGSTGTFTVTGVATGSATITANAPGYTSGSTNVTVAKLGAIKLPANVTVGPNQSASFPVTLVTGAPVGGVTITLTSSDPSTVQIPASVFIPQGQTAPSAQPQVTGVKFGSATITASAPGFDGDSQTVQVGAALSFSPKTLTIGAGGTANLTLNLSAPAPAGLTITLSSDNSSVASVPSSIAFPANATSVTVPVTGGSSGSATIHASSPPNLADTTATVSVAVLGSIILPANQSVNLGQSAALAVSLSATAPAGGTTVTLTSSDPSKLTISPSTVTIATGKTTPDVLPQMTGVGVGTVNITATAPAFTSATQAVSITASLSFTPQNITVQAAGTQNVTLSLPAPTPTALTITLTSDNLAVASVPPSVTIPANAIGATVLVTGVGPGSTKLHATAPPNLQADANVTVESPGPIGIPSNLSVPLGQSAQFAVTLPKAAASAVTVTLSSSDSSKVSISPSTVTIAAGQTTPATQPQVTGASLGSANITASAAGYTTAVQAVQVTATLAFSPQNVTIIGTTTQNVTLNLSAVTPVALTVSLSSDKTSVVTVPASVTIPANQSSVTVQLTGVALGSATIHASAPPNVPDTTANVTVQNPGTINLASGVSVALGGSAPMAVSLAQAAPAAVTITLSSSDPSKVSISPASVTIAAGQTAPATQPQVTGVSIGSANITASATGYTSATQAVNVTATVSFSPQNVSIIGFTTQNVTLNLSAITPAPVVLALSSSNTGVATVPASVTIPANTSSTTVQITGVAVGSAVIHASAAGIPDATANVSVSLPTPINVPANTTAPLGQPVQFAVSLAAPAISPVTINLSSSNGSIVSVSPSSVTIASGATTPATQPQVTGMSPGSANITASATGFAPGTGAVNVTAALAFSPQDITMGPGGSQTITLSLPAKTVNPLNVTLTSDNTAVATVAGSVMIAANTQSASVTVNGVAAGSTAIHATAANVTAAAATVTVQSDIILTPTTVSPGQQAQLPLSLAKPAGQDVVFIQLTSSDTSKVTVQTPVVRIQPGQTMPSTPPIINGLDFGSVTITAATFGLTPASVTVTVGATLSFNSDSVTVAPSATQPLGLNLSAAPPTSPVVVTLSSSDPTIATVPSSITIPAGQQSVLIQVTGVAVGQAIITASTNVPTIPNATTKVTVGAPGLIVLPSNISENIGETVPFPVNLSSPAGVNGVTVTLKATDGISFVPLTCPGTPCPAVPPGATQTTVTIPPGQTAPASQPQMRGVSPGPITITATAPGYDIATTQTQVTATFQFSPPTLTINPQATGFLLLALSGPAAPPPTGLTVTFTSSNPSVATVAATFTYFWDGSTVQALNIPITGVAPGTTVITAKAANMADATATVTVSGPVTITTASLPDGTVGAAYSTTVAASGGATPYTWSATGLPAGLSINASSGQISGTPTATGVSTVSITVTDSTSPSHQTASTSLSLSIRAAGTVSITTASPLPGGVVGTAYSTTVAATGGTTPYTWSATGLPAGLSINASTGVISGNPTTAGASTAVITVTDSTNPTHLTATANLAITIIAPPSITTTSLPGGNAGAAYSATVNATGGTTPYTWSATGLPNGVGIDASSGVISGTPSGASSGTVVITVTDSTNPAHLTATKSLSLTITGQLTITTSALPSGTVGTPYPGVTLAATGGITPYTWSATGLPSGLTIDPSTGVIGGTAKAAATNTVVITVTDSTSPAHLTATKSLSITITGQLTITTSSLPGGVVGTAYPSATLAATGGVTPYTWSATGLPNGLNLNASTGAISGTPTTAGSNTVAITVTDSTSPNHLTATANLSLTVVAQPTITTSSLPGGVVGAAYSAALAASGGTTPYTWSATGLPGGLSIDASSGTISGNPTTAGTSTVSITVTDSTNPTHLTATRSLSLTVVAPVAITTTSLTGGVTGTGYNATVAATGGTTPYTWSATGLPAGLGIDANSGVISGTPTAAGTSTVVITVTDSTSPTHLSATKNLSLTIVGQLVITTASPLPGGSVNAPYSTTIAATGGTTPYTWSATGLPAGLSIDAASGAISGTPTAAGAATVVVTVMDAATSKQTATKNLSLTISLPVPASIVATAGGGQSAAVNTQYASQLQVTVRDASNVPVGGAVVTFTAPASGPSVTFSTGGNVANITTNSAGIANAPVMTANSSVGQFAVTASLGALTPASFTLNNTGVSLPAITVSNANIGQNLQGTLTIGIPAAAGTGGLQVVLTSGDPSRMLIGGRTSAKVTIPEGLSQLAVAAEALVSTGSTTVTATAPGYADGTGTVTMTPSGFVLAGPNDVGASFQTFQSLLTTMTVYSARLDASGKYVEKQPLRGSFGASVTVNLSSTSAGTVTPASVTFNPGDSSATTSFRAVSTGSATITAQAPGGFSTLTDGSNSVTATILQSGLILPSSVTVGQNLETTMAIGLSGVVGSGGSVMTITSNDPSRLKFATAPDAAGSGSITINLPLNAHGTPDFYVQGFGNNGTVGYTAQATGFGGAVSGTVSLTPSGIVFTNSFGGAPNPILAAVGGSPLTVTVYSARLDSVGNWAETQFLAGGLSATVNVTVGNASVGTVNPAQVTIAGGSNSATTQFQPGSAGTTNLSVSVPAAPAGFSTPSATYNTLPVSVTTSKIVLTQDQVPIGKDLEIQGSFVLSQPAPSGGLTVTLTSSDASQLLLAAGATDTGKGSIQINVPAGSTVASFYLQALGSSGAVTYKGSAAGYSDGNATILLTPSGVVLSDVNGVPFLSVSTGSPVTALVNMAQLNSADNTYSQTQPLRGGLTLNVTINTGNQGVATVDSPVAITGGADPATITTLVHGIGAGQTPVTATQPPGYVAATNGVFAFRPMPSINVTVN